MGQFSWLDCNTGEQILDDVVRDVYVKVPREFRETYGKHITEHKYDGYGNFGGYDIYDLVALWNLNYIKVEDIEVPEKEQYVNEEYFEKAMERYNVNVERMKDFIEGKLSEEEMKAKYGKDYLRLIGIDIACGDERNSKLKYPIKITYDKTDTYETYSDYSKDDPNQGWLYEDTDED